MKAVYVKKNAVRMNTVEICINQCHYIYIYIYNQRNQFEIHFDMHTMLLCMCSTPYMDILHVFVVGYHRQRPDREV